MKSYYILTLLMFFPLFLTCQILREETTLIHDYGSERWENVHYVLRQYETRDSAVEMSLKDILNIDSLAKNPSGWRYLMFVETENDSMTLRIELQNAPYKLQSLKGFFKIHDVEILFYNKIPPFLEPTRSSKTFRYVRHLFSAGRGSWIEFPGDDCSHSWTLIFFDNSLHVKK